MIPNPDRAVLEAILAQGDARVEVGLRITLSTGALALLPAGHAAVGPDELVIVLEPELRVRWEHDILDAGTKTTQWIGDQQFTATSAKAGRDAGVFGAGIAAIIDKDMRLYAHYDSEVRANQIDHIVTAGFRYSW